MSADTFTNEQISSRLRESLDRLHRETLRVEIWAGALSAFVQPIPDYDLPADFVLPPNKRPS
jgi:hypothetical protein